MIVTVAGDIASGKSTLARGLSERLGFRHVSAGEIMRSLAEEAGMSLLDYSKYAENHFEVDRLIDERQKAAAMECDCVVDGRLSAYFLDSDFRVYLTASPEVLAKRLAGRDGVKNPLGEIRRRRASERKRYKKIYGIDVTDLGVYSMVLDTSGFSADDVLDIVCRAVEKLRR